MVVEHNPNPLQLQAFVEFPREDLGVEYKSWLDLTSDEGRGTFAKAAMAIANYGGGFIVLGFMENNGSLESMEVPSGLPTINQDRVSQAVHRYAEPNFHCELYWVKHPSTGAIYAVVRVPGSDVPVMSKSDHQTAGLAHRRVYIRKPGPLSEEPHTPEEWRTLLDRCVRARRELMLDAIRSIVSGRVDTEPTTLQPMEELKEYCASAYSRWQQLVSEESNDSPNRFPYGYYEMGFSLVDANPAEDLSELNRRLRIAQQTKLSGWSPFQEIDYMREWQSYVFQDSVEAWLGRPIEDGRVSSTSRCDFWRVSRNGMLYTIRGYVEDIPDVSNRIPGPGTSFDCEVPIMRVAEGLLFASRFAATYGSILSIAMHFNFSGLQDRSLVALDPRLVGFWGNNYMSRDYNAEIDQIVGQQDINNNLAEVLNALLHPLYERFGFFNLSLSQIQRVLKEMRVG